MLSVPLRVKILYRPHSVKIYYCSLFISLLVLTDYHFVIINQFTLCCLFIIH